MFTGLIESLGTVERMIPSGNYSRLVIRPEKPFEDIRIGESIAVSGPCLTVTDFDKTAFSAEASQETMRVTSLGRMQAGTRVNLERAVRADSRLGGHFVSGHIDTTAPVRSVKKIGLSLEIEILLPERFATLVVDKGSIAVDGVSLTICRLEGESFAINLIPETQNRTTLDKLQAGELVNLEFDLIGKYIIRFLSGRREATTWEKLHNLGY